MLKKFLSSTLIVSSLLFTVPAVAATTTVDRTAVISCVGAAVATREAAVSSAFNTFSTAQTAALSTRASALQAAWSGGDVKAVRTAVNAAWSAYRTAHRAAVTAHNNATKAAWSAFKTASLACKPAKAGVPVESSVGQDMAQ